MEIVLFFRGNQITALHRPHHLLRLRLPESPSVTVAVSDAEAESDAVPLHRRQTRPSYARLLHPRPSSTLRRLGHHLRRRPCDAGSTSHLPPALLLPLQSVVPYLRCLRIQSRLLRPLLLPLRPAWHSDRLGTSAVVELG